MEDFVELCKGKPSNALQAMIDGLLASEEASNFSVDMETFGEVDWSGKCFGCAATCAIAQLTDISYLENEEMLYFTQERGCCTLFENAINDARTGDLITLLDLFGIRDFGRVLTEFVYDWADHVSLTTSNWRNQLPFIQKLVDELRKLGY